MGTARMVVVLMDDQTHVLTGAQALAVVIGQRGALEIALGLKTVAPDWAMPPSELSVMHWITRKWR